MRNGPPDEHAAGIELTYKGDRLAERRTKVGNPFLTAVTRQYSDRFGRIVKVEEPTGGAKAEYGFNEAGVAISTAAGSSAS